MTGTTSNQRATLALALCGGLAFWAILQWRYMGIDPDLYQYRDDGVITLSHARNWIEYGIVGVNPSGERVEAVSAPLQFLLYALVYALSGIGYAPFMDAQLFLCTFAMGALVALLFADRPLFALGAAAGTAAVLTQMPAFLVWHASGMENPITHLMLLWTVVLLYRCTGTGRIPRAAFLVPFAASISRVDAIMHVLPVVLVFCIYWEWKVKDRQARVLLAAVMGLWLAFNAARYFYFGSLLPNTAVAQGISVGERILELLHLSPLYLDQSFALARGNFSRHGGYLLLLALPFVAFRAHSERAILLVLMLACLLLTGLFTPFLFGPARLDAARTTTQMAVFIPLVVAAAAHGWQPRRADAYALPLMALVVFLLFQYNRSALINACCSVRGFDGFRVEFARVARENGIHRPTVLNPDLGVVSFHKQFNVVDLGALGSPIVAHLGPGPALDRFLFEHAAPDIVESHGFWTCHFASFFADPRFRAAYVEATAPGRQVVDCKNMAAVPTGTWVRRDVLRGSGSAERSFMDALAQDPSAERVAAELSRCQQAAGGAPTACTYVARSVYRMLPELRARGEQDKLEALFAGSRTRDIDLYLLTGGKDGTAYRKALVELRAASGEL